jgi:hypothetical protein
VKSFLSATTVVLTAALFYIGVTTLVLPSRDAHGATIPSSGNVALIPTRPDLAIQSAAPGDVSVAADQAMSTAMAVWKLSASQVDPSVGVVRADASIRGDEKHQHQKVWVVVADRPTSGPDGQQHSKLCIVVDGRTGSYLYSYPAD